MMWIGGAPAKLNVPCVSCMEDISWHIALLRRDSKEQKESVEDNMLFAAVAQTRPAGAPEIKLIRCSGAAVPAAKPVVQSSYAGDAAPSDIGNVQ